MTEPIEPSDTGSEADTDVPLTPEQEAAVRRALADAGGPEPMPEEIVDRLDAVITDLAAERAATPEISHPEDHRVLPLDPAARRRRVRARILLAAAAVVVAGAVGAGVITDRGDSDLSTADQMAENDPVRSSAADDDGAALADGKSASGRDQLESAHDTTDGVASPELATAPRRIVTDEPLRTVRPDQLREDLVALQHVSLPHPAAADYTDSTLTAPEDFMCEPAAYGNGYLVGVSYDGKPAVVAFRKPVGETQEAEVLACGTGDVLHSTTLAATG